MLRVFLNGARANCSRGHAHLVPFGLTASKPFVMQATSPRCFSTASGGNEESTEAKRAFADQGRSFKASRPRKLSKSRFLARELKENPEFFKAFPHLQPPVYDLLNPEVQQHNKGKSLEYLDQVRSREIYDKEELKASSTKRDGYF